jgi:hypothetical protein
LLLSSWGWGLYQKHEGRVEGRQEVQTKFDAFVNETKAAGLKAEADKLAKEKADNEKINSAVVARDVALARLQSAQAANSAGRRVLSGIPTSPGSPDKICFSRARFESAFGTLNTDLQGIAQRGDTAIIDNKAWLNSWPTQPPASERTK